MKKFASLFLALALCMGLTVPAFAAERKDVMGLSSDDENPFHTEKVEYVDSSAYNDLYYVDSFKGWYPIAPGTTFTVTNKGTENDGSYGIVYLQAYTRQPAGTTVESMQPSGAYEELDIGGKYLSVDRFYLVTGHSSVTGYPSYLFAEDGLYWEHSAIGATDDVVKLDPGESVSFTLPKMEGDVIYRLYTATCYPAEDQEYYTWYLFKEGSSAAPAEPAKPAAPQFSDMPSKAYYADAVKWAVGKEITTGTTAATFSPNNTCTTAQILTFLWRAAGSPEPKNLSAFSDVKTDAYYAKAAAWAKENGMVSGDALSPNAPCTRLMAVEFMWKQAGSPNADKAGFTDVSSDAVNWAVKNGVTSGTTADTFSPNTVCTRAQIVTFLYRAFAE